MADVTELQKRLNSEIKEEASAPTAGDTTWNLYLNYLNRAQHDWQEAYFWPTLYKEVNTRTSQSTGNATISLPSDFRKLDGPIRIAHDGGVFSYPEIEPQLRNQYDRSDRYAYKLGNPSNGYKLIISPGTHGSGASIFYSYYASAGTLASPADVSMCPDPNYLVEKTLEYYWRSRDDNRFQLAKAEAARTLARMLEFEVVHGHGYDNRVQTREEARYNFRIGRD